MSFSILLYENWRNRRTSTSAISEKPLKLSWSILKENLKNFIFLFLTYFFLVTLINSLTIVIHSGIFTNYDKIQNKQTLTRFPSNFVVVLLSAIPRLMVFRLISNTLRRENHKLLFSDILQIKQFLNYNLFFKEFSFLLIDHVLSDVEFGNGLILSITKTLLKMVFHSVFGFTEFFFIDDPQIPLIHCYQWSFLCFIKDPSHFIVYVLFADTTKNLIITVPFLLVFEAVMFYQVNGNIKRQE